MRVAYLCLDPGSPIGGTKGACVHVGELVAALASAGADVLLLAASAEADSELPRGVRVETVPSARRGASAAERMAHDDARARWLECRLKAFEPDLVFERLALYSAAGARAARALAIPFVVELNAPLLAEALRYRQLEEPDAAARLERATLVGADLVFAVSASLVVYAESRGARRVELLPNAVAAQRFGEPPRRDGAQAPTAVFSGNLRPWHGIECIAAAWRLLGRSAPRLLVIGDGPGRDVLQSVGAEITGALPHERVPSLLAQAHIGLAPYAVDAPDYFSPLKVFEYLAAGLATVVGDIDGLAGVVREGEAVVIPRGDAVALAHAVARLANDPQERARLGQVGRAYVLSQHTWEQRAERVLAGAAGLAAVGALS
jgi:glycosyltransferase involved in cell wall biosynthesis